MTSSSMLFCNSCGYRVQLIFVHSHYQCPLCGINVHPCCEGENTELNDVKPDWSSQPNNEDEAKYTLPILR